MSLPDMVGYNVQGAMRCAPQGLGRSLSKSLLLGGEMRTVGNSVLVTLDV